MTLSKAQESKAGSGKVGNLSRRSRSGNETLESLFDFRGFEPKRSGLALVSDAALTIDHVEPVRPCGVSPFRGVLDIVDDGGNTQCQLGGASTL
jgi:hypothetical protein